MKIKHNKKNSIVKAKSIDEAVEIITTIYRNDCVSMCDILATTEIRGLSVEDVVTTYARLISMSDDDAVILVREGEAEIII